LQTCNAGKLNTFCAANVLPQELFQVGTHRRRAALLTGATE